MPNVIGDIRYIASRLSREDILCQLAEEAAELAQAALKLRRAMMTYPGAKYCPNCGAEMDEEDNDDEH